MQGKTPHETDLAAANGGQTASLITQLHGLIRLLQARTDLPLSEFGDTDVAHYAKSASEVDDIACTLGLIARWNDDATQYVAEYRIGPNVAYRVVFITPDHMTAYSAHMATFARPALVAEVAA